MASTHHLSDAGLDAPSANGVVIAEGGGSALLRGVSPVLEVPFTDRGEVDHEGFDRVVAAVLGTGVNSVLFPGFASEFYKLTDSERTALLEQLLAHTRGRDDVAAVVAVQDHATRLAVARAQDAVTRGADLINVLPPHFLTPGRSDVLDHLAAVLAAVAPVPVVIQFAPNETGTALAIDDLRSLAEAHPNLYAVKVESMPPGQYIAELASGTRPIRGIEGYAGVQLPDAHRRGAIATQPGCSFTEIYQAIWSHLESSNPEPGLDLHRRLLPYISFWMLDTERIIAAEKTISKRRGWFASDYCRSPRYRHDREDLAMIDRFIQEFADFLG